MSVVGCSPISKRQAADQNLAPMVNKLIYLTNNPQNKRLDTNTTAEATSTTPADADVDSTGDAKQTQVVAINKMLG